MEFAVHDFRLIGREGLAGKDEKRDSPKFHRGKLNT